MLDPTMALMYAMDDAVYAASLVRLGSDELDHSSLISHHSISIYNQWCCSHLTQRPCACASASTMSTSGPLLLPPFHSFTDNS